MVIQSNDNFSYAVRFAWGFLVFCWLFRVFIVTSASSDWLEIRPEHFRDIPPTVKNLVRDYLNSKFGTMTQLSLKSWNSTASPIGYPLSTSKSFVNLSCSQTGRHTYTLNKPKFCYSLQPTGCGNNPRESPTVCIFQNTHIKKRGPNTQTHLFDFEIFGVENVWLRRVVI